jgi:protein-disulfide isomerase
VGRRRWLVPVLIVVVAGLLIGASLTRSGASQDAGSPGGAARPGTSPTPGGGSGADQPTGGPAGEVVTPQTQPTLDMARRRPGDPLAVGPADAPVTLVVYSDFQCPFCAAWSHDTLPRMLSYAKAGDLRIEFRDVAVFGEPSLRAARAAYAAGLQGRYLAYHEALFAGGDKRSPAQLTDQALTDVAVSLGLDRERFVADLGSDRVRRAVQSTVDEAMRIGVFSTPAFLLDGKPILGAQPTQVFVDAVEAALHRAR